MKRLLTPAVGAILLSFAGSAIWAQTDSSSGPPTSKPVPPGLPAAPATPGKALPPRAGGSVSVYAGNNKTGSYRTTAVSESSPPLVIRFDNMDPKVAASLEEDLSVMSHVIGRTLERAASDDKVVNKLGVPMLLTGSGRSVRAIYVEGVGPLFMIKVDFPLLGTVEKEPAPENESDDSEWSAARRELYGSGGKWSREYHEDPRFSAEQVDTLRHELAAALKNAANIRGLKPSDFVSIAVFGSPGATGPVVATFSNGSSKSKNLYTTLVSGGSGRGTVLTLRVAKGDIDACAAGKLDQDAFEKKIHATTYVGSGYNVSSINSWSSGGSGGSSYGLQGR